MSSLAWIFSALRSMCLNDQQTINLRHFVGPAFQLIAWSDRVKVETRVFNSKLLTYTVSWPLSRISRTEPIKKSLLAAVDASPLTRNQKQRNGALTYLLCMC